MINVTNTGFDLCVVWSLTNRCFNKCRYCFTHSTSDEENFPSKEKYLTLIDKILSYNYKSFTFQFLGGEPLLHPYLRDIISVLEHKNNVKEIVVFTSQINDICFKHNVKPIITIHPSTTKNIDDYFSFISKREREIEVNLMLDPTCIEKTISIYNRLVQFRNLVINAKQILNPPYFNKFVDFPIAKYDIVIKEKNLPQSYRGKFCLHGTTLMSINKNLQVQGSIFCNHPSEFFPKIVRCTMSKCHCRINRCVIKTNTKEEAQQIINNIIKSVYCRE